MRRIKQAHAILAKQCERTAGIFILAEPARTDTAKPLPEFLIHSAVLGSFNRRANANRPAGMKRRAFVSLPLLGAQGWRHSITIFGRFGPFPCDAGVSKYPWPRVHSALHQGIQPQGRPGRLLCPPRKATSPAVRSFSDFKPAGSFAPRAPSCFPRRKVTETLQRQHPGRDKALQSTPLLKPSFSPYLRGLPCAGYEGAPTGGRPASYCSKSVR
jgi:hypothetical protein